MPFLDLVRTYNALAIVHEVARFFVLAALFRVAVSAALRRRTGCRKLPFRCRASWNSAALPPATWRRIGASLDRVQPPSLNLKIAFPPQVLNLENSESTPESQCPG